MGCDIHLVVEKKHNGNWVMVNRIMYPSKARERNYDRFAALAGVRGYGPAPKGVPDDVSESTQMYIEEWGDDGHSHSWDTLAAASKIFSETEDRDPLELTDYQRLYPESHYFDIEAETEEDKELYRIVYWFDN